MVSHLPSRHTRAISNRNLHRNSFTFAVAADTFSNDTNAFVKEFSGIQHWSLCGGSWVLRVSGHILHGDARQSQNEVQGG